MSMIFNREKHRQKNEEEKKYHKRLRRLHYTKIIEKTEQRALDRKGKREGENKCSRT
jgi:hypothetical protein